MKHTVMTLVAAAVIVLGSEVRAAYVSIGSADFAAGAGSVDYTTKPLGVISSQLLTVGEAGSSGVTQVSYGGLFSGMAIEAVCLSLIACRLTDNTPTGPLGIASGTQAQIVTDSSATGVGIPALSGAPSFFGPIAIMFDHSVMAAGIFAGSFNALGSTMMLAFDDQGTPLSSIPNTVQAQVDAGGLLVAGSGWQFMGIASTDINAPKIKGIVLAAVDVEALGFVIGNLRFGDLASPCSPTDPNCTNSIPEPPAGLLLVAALAAASLARRRRA